MASLSPEINGNIGFEQPVRQANPLGALEVGLSLFESVTRPAQTSAGDRKNVDLQPFAAKLESINNSDMTDSEKRRAIQATTRDAITAFPAYESAITSISGQYGQEEQVLQTAPRDAYSEGYNKWLETTSGQYALASALSEGLNEEDSALYAHKKYNEHLAEQDQIEASNRKLTKSQNDTALWKSESEQEMSKFVPSWTARASDRVSSITDLVAKGDAKFDTVEEVLQGIALIERQTRDEYIAAAQGANIHHDVYTAQIDTALTPITNFKQMIENNIESFDLAKQALEKASRLGLTRELIEQFGNWGSDPKFTELAIPNLLQLPSAREKLQDFFEAADVALQSGATDDLSTIVGVNQVDNPLKAGAEGTSVVNNDLVANIRTKAAEDPTYLTRGMDSNVTSIAGIPEVSSPKGIGSLTYYTGQYVAHTEASEAAVGPGRLSTFFSPQNVRKFSQAIAQNSVQSKDLEAVLTNFVGKQVSRNKQIVDSKVRQSDGTYQVRNEGGQLVVYTLRERFTEQGSLANPNPGTTLQAKRVDISKIGDKDFRQAVQNINYLNSSLKSILTGSSNKDQILTDSDQLIEGAGDDELGGSAGADRLINLIDRTEGGGSYDTLFDHSQRPGKAFEGVQVTQMTLDEASRFSQGEYAAWSRDQLGYTATPMGRYQIVGDTLRQTMKEMGLPGNILFTDEVQDAMFHHLAKKSLAGKDSPAAKRKALRGTWEGFKHVSDEELDQAIAEFEGTEPPSYVELQRGGDNMSSLVRTSVRPPEGFDASVGTGGTRGAGGGSTVASGPSTEVPQESLRPQARPTGNEQSASSKVTQEQTDQLIATILDKYGSIEEFLNAV